MAIAFGSFGTKEVGMEKRIGSSKNRDPTQDPSYNNFLAKNV